MPDLHNLQRFVDAQDPVYDQVRRELRAGEKQSHWMWFVFPQLRGLGHSFMAQRYAIASLEEARAYLQHPVLGQRLQECTRLVNQVEGRSVHEIFGYPDDLKFHSSMTLFANAVSPGAEGASTARHNLFQNVLDKYFAGQRDRVTIELLRKT